MTEVSQLHNISNIVKLFLLSPDMRSTTVFSTLGILCVVLSLKCNADKTELIIGSLERSEDKDRGVQLGITHAIHVAKNSSSLKDFLKKYEIRIVSYHTRVSCTNVHIQE